MYCDCVTVYHIQIVYCRALRAPVQYTEVQYSIQYFSILCRQGFKTNCFKINLNTF